MKNKEQQLSLGKEPGKKKGFFLSHTSAGGYTLASASCTPAADQTNNHPTAAFISLKKRCGRLKKVFSFPHLSWHGHWESWPQSCFHSEKQKTETLFHLSWRGCWHHLIQSWPQCVTLFRVMTTACHPIQSHDHSIPPYSESWPQHVRCVRCSVMTTACHPIQSHDHSMPPYSDSWPQHVTLFRVMTTARHPSQSPDHCMSPYSESWPQHSESWPQHVTLFRVMTTVCHPIQSHDHSMSPYSELWPQRVTLVWALTTACHPIQSHDHSMSPHSESWPQRVTLFSHDHSASPYSESWTQHVTLVRALTTALLRSTGKAEYSGKTKPEPYLSWCVHGPGPAGPLRLLGHVDQDEGAWLVLSIPTSTPATQQPAAWQAERDASLIVTGQNMFPNRTALGKWTHQ